jgi:rhodanese-related sulfurtransferase
VATVQDIKNAQPGKLKLIDIRKNPDERQIPGSMRASGEELETMVDLPFSKDEHVVLYCGSGNSCSRVAQTLREKGYTNAEALEGGYTAWTDAGLPTEPRA